MSILKIKRITSHLQGIIYLSAIILLSGASELHGQNKINSPYSMFGPGEVSGHNNFRNMSMGGVSQAFRSNTSVNYINPASYTAVDSLSFIFEGIVFSHFYQQKQADQNQMSNYSTLGNFNFAFPVTRWWSVAAGLLPYSQLGYDIKDFSTDETHGRINYLYKGNGGINKVYLGHGFKILPSLSVGINAAYLFGKIQDQSIAASDSLGFYTSIWSNTGEIDGLMLSYGLQWHHNFNDQRRLNIGATYTHETPLDLKQSRTLSRELPGQVRLDTLNHITGETGKMNLPVRMGIGAFMDFNRTLSAGIDYETQSWSDFTTPNTIQNLNDAYQVRLGGIYRPTIETYSTFFSRLEYRAGFRYGKSFINWDNQDFNEIGISFGVGIPVRRSLSGLNIGFEYSTRDSGNPDMLKEDFFKINVGVNIYERWFVRRKFY